MSNAKILVTGATGTVGTQVVFKLIEARQKVRVLVRNSTKAKNKFGNWVEIAQADLSKPKTIGSAFYGIEKALVISAPDIINLEINTFKSAKAAGVKHIVKLSGVPVYMDRAREMPLAKWNLRSENFLRGLDIAWTILRPSFFMSNMMMWGVKETGMLALPVGEGKDAPIDPRDISEVAAKVLSSMGHENKIYELTGPELISQKEMLQKVSAAIGKSLNFVDVDPEIWLKHALDIGFPRPVADSMLKYFAMVKSGELSFVRQTVPSLLSRSAYTFDQWLDSSGFV